MGNLSEISALGKAKDFPNFSARPALSLAELRQRTPPPRWNLKIISHLIIALQVCYARIAQLEELDHQKAVALDEQRRRFHSRRHPRTADRKEEA